MLLRRVRGSLRSRESAGLDPYSSHDIKPASLGEPEKDALQLEGRGPPVSGQDDPLPGQVVAKGGEWDRGMDMDLLCWRVED